MLHKHLAALVRNEEAPPRQWRRSTLWLLAAWLSIHQKPDFEAFPKRQDELYELYTGWSFSTGDLPKTPGWGRGGRSWRWRFRSPYLRGGAEAGLRRRSGPLCIRRNADLLRAPDARSQVLPIWLRRRWPHGHMLPEREGGVPHPHSQGGRETHTLTL